MHAADQILTAFFQYFTGLTSKKLFFHHVWHFINDSDSINMVRLVFTSLYWLYWSKQSVEVACTRISQYEFIEKKIKWRKKKICVWRLWNATLYGSNLWVNNKKVNVCISVVYTGNSHILFSIIFPIYGRFFLSITDNWFEQFFNLWKSVIGSNKYQ